MGKSKIIYGGEVLMDLTGDSVTPETLLVGATAHNMAGDAIEGACTFDADTSDGTLKAAEALEGTIAYGRGTKIVGTMPNNGSVNETIDTKNEEFTIPQGYHDGSGKVKIPQVEQDKITPQNIKEGVSILGVVGTLEPSSSVTAQAKTVNPSTAKQVIIPDEGTDYLSQVTVNGISYVETSNSAGGITVTIAG